MTDIRTLLADFCATRYNQVALRNELVEAYAAHVKAGGAKAYVVNPCDGHGKAIAVDRLHARGVHTYYVTDGRGDIEGALLLTSIFDQHTLGHC
jgi:hypothetical protein